MRRCCLYVVFFVAMGSGSFAKIQRTAEDNGYLSWNTNAIQSITKAFRVNGQVGGSFDFRITSTDRSYNYKLRATWFTPEMIRASARYWQMRERLTNEQTHTLVDEAESAGDTVIMVELDPREGSGVIPSDWIAVLKGKGSSVGAKGVISPALRSVKAFAGAVQRDYAYDVFWVVFPFADETGQMILPDSVSAAELTVSIYNKEGKVTWQVPDSIRQKTKAGIQH